ncbi:MAG: metallophosphoesterase family protein [Clostridium sp.]
MDKIKILHCADIHFDTPFKEFNGDLALRSKEEIREVFSNIIDLCIKSSIQILLIAGDVFDNLTVNRDTLKYIERELLRIPHIYIFISPGNHDPYNTKSFYKLVNWPENVHIFTGDMESIEISKLNTNVWGVGFNNKYQHKTLLRDEIIKNNFINLMVMHGEITSSNSHYNPITVEDIGNSNMDYIALGHTHQFSGILKSNNTYYAYSGCPQGRGFDEQGRKGIILGEVSKGANNLKFIPTSRREYVEVKVDISECNSIYEIVGEIIASKEEHERKNNFYKIILRGDISENININIDLIKEKLSNEFYFCKIKDETSVKLNIEELRDSISIKGMYAQKLLDDIDMCNDEEEKKILEMALKLGLKSLTLEEVNLDDY